MQYESVKKIKEFNDLKAWQAAYKLSIDIYTISKLFPSSEIYGLTSQIRRSSVSIAANIAEGFGKRTYKEKVHYYYQAHGSLVETKSHVLISKGLNYMTKDHFTLLTSDLSDAQSLLQGLLKSTKSKIVTTSDATFVNRSS